MSVKYVIRWKSKVNGRAGRGTKEFSRQEGERLVAELNEEYPDIEHELITPPPPDSAESGEAHCGEPSDDPHRRTAHAASYE